MVVLANFEIIIPDSSGIYIKSFYIRVVCVFRVKKTLCSLRLCGK
jgi:hypothetical protein